MVFFSTVSSMLQGFHSARALVLFKADEDAAETGGNWMVKKVSQYAQTVFCLESIDYLEAVVGQPYLSRTVRLLIYLSPFAALFSQKMVAIARAHQEREEDGPPAVWLSVAEWTHRCVGTKLSDHVGSICQVATLITNLALLRLGYRAYSLTSLAILGWGLLDRHHYLPQKMRGVYKAVAPWISGASCFVAPQSWFTRCIVVFEWGVKISKWLTVPRYNLPYAEAPLPPRLPFQQFQRICNRLQQRGIDVDLGVCREHVRIAPFPVVVSPAELISKDKMGKRVQPLYDLCNRFAWENEKNYASLKSALQLDSRWPRSTIFQSSAYQNADKAGDEVTIQRLNITYAKERFQGLIESVVEENINTGTPLDYGILKNYLAFIADELPKAGGLLQVQVLIQLAVEGGDYCGPGIYFQLEMAATALLSGGVTGEYSRLPLRQRILLTLQQDRLRIVQAMHLSVPALMLEMKGGVGDIHAFNRTIRVVADDFGLPDQGAQQDETAYVSYFDKLILRSYGIEGCQPEDLWKGGRWGEGYTRKRIVDTVMSHIGSRLMPNEDIYAWAREWIAQTSSDQATQEDFLEKLVDGVSFEHNCRFRRAFIEAMLIDMGILSVS